MFSSACIKVNVNKRNTLSLIMSLAFVNITCFNIYTGDSYAKVRKLSGSSPLAIIISTVTSIFILASGDMLKFATVARFLKFVYKYIKHRKLSGGNKYCRDFLYFNRRRSNVRSSAVEK